MVLSTCMQEHAKHAKIHVKKLQMEAPISMFNIGVVGWMSYLVWGGIICPHIPAYMQTCTHH